MIEVACAFLAVCGALGAGAIIGRSITRSRLLVMLGSAAVGVACAVLFFMATVAAALVMPDQIEAWLVGRCLILVAVVAPLGGALVAAAVHWRVGRADAMRLPF